MKKRKFSKLSVNETFFLKGTDRDWTTCRKIAKNCAVFFDTRGQGYPFNIKNNQFVFVDEDTNYSK